MDHKILLILSIKPINIRAYRSSFIHKKEIERLVKEIINGIIQLNNSPFASPIWLVKKKDKTRGLCGLQVGKWVNHKEQVFNSIKIWLDKWAIKIIKFLKTRLKVKLSPRMHIADIEKIAFRIYHWHCLILKRLLYWKLMFVLQE